MTMPDATEKSVENALQPGRFISSRDTFEFVEEIERVAKQIQKLVPKDAARAAETFETFIAGCFEKASELDDSGGNFGMFVSDLFCAWIRARTKAGAAPEETIHRLLAWEDKDEYGFCSQFERDAVKALNKKGMEAFERIARARHESSKDYARHRAGEMLRAIYSQQRNGQAYVDLCGEKPSQRDCLAIATMLKEPDKALVWVERGLGLSHESGCEYELTQLKRELLTKLGRGTDALADAWAAFERHPSTHTYDELMQYAPKGERSSWHSKALNATIHADLASVTDLLVATKEFNLLAERLRKSSDAQLEDLSHYTTEPAALLLHGDFPDVASRLYRAMAARILNARKSKYYDIALVNLESARDCFERASRTSAWTELVAEVRKLHARKTWFIQRFEKLAAGQGPSSEPSFLERARKRWPPS